MVNDKYHFEKIFRKKKFIFEEEDYVVDTAMSLFQKGKALDLGCGEGGNALYLAKKGFDVTCIDISKSAIKKIIQKAKREGLTNIDAKFADLENFNIEGEFEAIFCIASIHFLKKNRSLSLIRDIQEHTKVGGLNIITVLLENDPTNEQDGSAYFKTNELKSLYHNWEIKEYSEYKEKSDGALNSLARLIAIKK